MGHRSDTEARNSVLDQDEKFLTENGAWHSARIKAELQVRGLSLAELSRRHGYSATAAGRALRVPWPEMERLIAEAIGVAPQAIWPDRYSPDGVPLKYLPRRRTSQDT